MPTPHPPQAGPPFHLGRAFVSSNIIVLAAHLLVAMANVFLTAFLIRVAGSSTYGGYALITSVATLILGLSSLGVGFRYKRALPALAGDALGRRQKFYPQFYFQFAVVLVLTAGAWLASRPIATLLLDPGIELAAWTIPSYVLSYFLFTQACDYFRYSMRVEWAMLLSIMQPYGQILLIWLLHRWHGTVDLPAVFAAFALATLVSVAPFMGKMFREMGILRPTWDRGQLRDDIILGFPLILSFFADYALSSTARYALAIRFNLEVVAGFSAAYTIAALVSLIPRVTGTVLPPLMSRAFDSAQPADAEKTLAWSLRGFLFLAIPFVAGSCVLGRDALAMLATPALAESAWPLVPILALGMLFYGLNIILNNVLFVILKTGLLFRITMLTAGLNLVLCVAGLLLWSEVMVVAVAQLLSYAIAFFFFRRKMRALWPVQFDRVFILQACIASVVMALAVFILRQWLIDHTAGWAILISCSLLGTFVYALFMFAIKAVPQEALLIRQFFRRVKPNPRDAA